MNEKVDVLNNDRWIYIGNDFIGKAFFWIANVFNPYDKKTCGRYYYDKPAEKEVAFVRKFTDLIDIIDVD